MKLSNYAGRLQLAIGVTMILAVIVLAFGPELRRQQSRVSVRTSVQGSLRKPHGFPRSQPKKFPASSAPLGIDRSLATESYDFGPSNDAFNSPTRLEGLNQDIRGNNTDGTLEASEPHERGGDRAKTVWFSWTAPSNASMTFEVHTDPGAYNFLYDPVVGIYSGNSLDSLTQVAWADDMPFWSDIEVTFIATAGRTYHIQVYGTDGGAGGFEVRWHPNLAESAQKFNFWWERSMPAVFRPATSVWWIMESSSEYYNLIPTLEEAGDVMAPADYDGDGGTDIAYWRPSTGTFYVYGSEAPGPRSVRWGMEGDQPVFGDFDGDKMDDYAVWRPASTVFWVLSSRARDYTTFETGHQGDIPVCADYDGDGKTDFAVRRVVNGEVTFVVRRSSDLSVTTTPFGLESDLTVPGDYDGDGKNDIAVYRSSNHTFYYIPSSGDGSYRGAQWGTDGDIPVAGDYTGDTGLSDLVVWRPSNGVYYILADGGNGPALTIQWGMNGDIPVASSYVH